jgi:hypothetical protein
MRKLTTDLYPVASLRKVELYLHPPNAFMAWCLIKHREEFTFSHKDKLK